MNEKKTAEEFTPTKAERWAYELVAKFAYGGYLDEDYPADKATTLIRDLIEEYAAQETAALRKEIAYHIAVNSLLTDSDGEADLANKLYNLTKENERLKEALKDMVSIAEQHYPEELERQYEPRIENAKKLTGQV